MSRYHEPYPFDNEPHAEREYKRNWKGMPSRHKWNTHPMRTHEKECRSCGYRYPHPELFEQGRDQQCWNCWFCQNEPFEVKRVWRIIDENSAKTKKTEELPGPKLKKAGQ